MAMARGLQNKSKFYTRETFKKQKTIKRSQPRGEFYGDHYRKDAQTIEP